MRCLLIDASGALSLAADGTVCGAADLVVLTSVEGDKVLNSPFNLTLDEGGQLGGAVLLVWAAAWGIRTIARILNVADDVRREE